MLSVFGLKYLKYYIIIMTRAKAAFVPHLNSIPLADNLQKALFSSRTAIVLKYLQTVYIWELSTLPSINYCFANIPIIDKSLNMDALRFSLTPNTNNQNGTEVFTRLVLSQKMGFGSTDF